MKRALAVAFAVGLGSAILAGGAGAAVEASPAGLHRFGTCIGFLGYVKRNAKRIVEPWGLPGASRSVLPATDDASGGESDALGPEPGVDFSTTNVQEAGVDEPDLVKTDGSTIFALAGGRLHAVDVSAGEPRLLDSLELSDAWSAQLLLHGQRLLVLSTDGAVIALRRMGRDSLIAPTWPTPRTVLTLIDVSSPASMQVIERLSVDGSLVTARLTGSTARVVITSSPSGLAFEGPQGSGRAAERKALRRNRALVERSTVRNWLPSYRLESLTSGTMTDRRALPCRSVARPSGFSGLGTLSVLTLDLDRGLRPVDSDAIFAGGELAYASPESLYVATQRWADWGGLEEGEVLPESVTTEIHRFDASSPGSTSYAASGAVSGYLLSQWAMSEHEGLLRVASTDAPLWWGASLDQEPESRVTVLAQDGASLRQVGEVTGLGRGERIYAVRFLGELGYVVTFRQVDPLYVVDLSDPTSPAVVGELELLGYSAYLHPIGDGLLLGVGQDATPDGQLLGTQVSLFDVSDPASPRLVDRRALAPGWSEVEWDHHAFLWWAPTGLAVLPVFASFWDETSGEILELGGAVGVRAGPSGLSEVGRVTHPAGQIRRSVVARDLLYTISDAGVRASSLDTLADRGWLPFPSYEPEPPPIPEPGQTEPEGGGVAGSPGEG